jgi:hypothetical protein
MRPTLNEKFIAYLALITGLVLSAVAVYYSVVGLTAIFSAAVVPIIIMGTALEISKLVATIWLKQNWDVSPRSIKIYLISAIVILMLITSMGIFGFLSKAHNDQNLVSGEVLSKIAIYDEKIRIAKENIDANRRALKQLDEAVDQVMGRSTSESGAERSVQIRRQQGPERQRLIREIEAEQKKISSLNEERAPIAAEVRKVEAEVGPIKYIANFFYGETDATILEKAVVWVIITLIIVFDPLAVILLLASQFSFQHFRDRELALNQPSKEEPLDTPKYEPDDGPLTTEQIEQIKESVTENLEQAKAGPQPIKRVEGTIPARTKIFPRKPRAEEQPAPTDTEITKEDYFNTIEKRRQSDNEDHVVFLATNIKAGRMTMNDVPSDLIERVKARL